MVKRFTVLLSALVLSASCGQRPSGDLALREDELKPAQLEVPAETMDEIIQNIASPIEVAALINALNIPFSKSYLAVPENLSSSTTSYEMAYSLGALSADLGYLNMYEKTGSAVNYLSAINRLAEALQVGQFFDFPTLKRLATSSGNLDSLVFLSMNSFNRMDDYLRETDRSNLSALMVSGVWIEGLYLSTQVARDNTSPELRNMIGEQKLILANLLLILQNYSNEQFFKNLLADYDALKSLYDRVKITYEAGDPQAIEKDGMLMVVQTETSHVSMSDKILNEIIETTKEIRNRHLNIQ
ncbi:MAG: hypothetical protein JXR52_07710 [Bacteroidales bacterium]|nr:hypothetical protein [Bacteroidales bacterium]MBN2698696.1 hypothetical protein [Bacteroidales bacterium]